jgi:hypothetical protein
LHHTFKATTIEKEVALEEVLNAKVEVLRPRNELCQAQTQVRQDALTIQTLELTKFNFANMQTQLDKSLAKNEEYQVQFPTLQNQLIVI